MGPKKEIKMELNGVKKMDLKGIEKGAGKIWVLTLLSGVGGGAVSQTFPHSAFGAILMGAGLAVGLALLSFLLGAHCFWNGAVSEQEWTDKNVVGPYKKIIDEQGRILQNMLRVGEEGLKASPPKKEMVH